MNVRPIQSGDWSEWLRMSMALHPDAPKEEIERRMREFTSRGDAAVFVAERPSGLAGGFIEVGSRGYGDGYLTRPVAHVDAWYVDPDIRRRGLGRTLLEAAERWARKTGHRVIASDSLLANDIGRRAHERSGYDEVERIVHYRKLLDESESRDTR